VSLFGERNNLHVELKPGFKRPKIQFNFFKFFKI